MRLSPAFFLLALVLPLTGCSSYSIGFGRKVTDEERILRDEIKAYYSEVGAAFAAGNADLLANLYDPGIAKPMTQEQIRQWGKDFFAKHGPARFKIVKMDIEQVGHVSAVVTVDYRVDTREGEGSFAGVERDQLVHRSRRWFVSSWEKAAPDR